MPNFNLQKLAASWGMYFMFGKIPKSWRNKVEVREFLMRNTDIIVWMVKETNLGIEAGFKNAYTNVINNEVLFDVFFDTMCDLWVDPSKLIIDNNQPINIDDKRLIERIRERIKNRRAKPGTPVAAAVEAAAPQSLLAVVMLISAISNIAAIILRFKQFRRQSP